MNKKTRTGVGLVFFLLLGLFTQSALGLGLGNASVESYLNQPLQARIELITRETDDLSSVTASLASAEDFELIGADRSAISVPLRFTVEQDGENASILVTSQLAVKDPVVRLIVEVNWSSGRMLREYTLFLDPPAFDSAAPSPVVDERTNPPASASSSAASTSPASSTSEETTSAAATPGQDEVDYSGMDGDEYGPVQSGETLWRIASNWSQGSGADVNKVMVAIQRNNPQAFINGNINLLKRGAILRMPQRDEIGEISAALAREEVIKQEQEFRQSAGTSVGPTAVETPLIDEQSDPLDASDRSGQEISEGQLELVPPSEEVDIDSAYGFEESLEEADADTAVQLLREELSRTEEELIVEQEQNQYLQERLTELEEQLAASTEGSVEDAELAQLEDTLRDDRLAGGSFESGQAQGEEANDTQAPPKVVTSDPSDDGNAWYSGFWFWLIVILVVVGGAGWFLSRRNADNVIVSDVGSDDDGTVREIKDEAEKILEALGSDADSDSEEFGDEGDDESDDEPDETSEPEGQDETTPGNQSRASARRDHSEDAEILDEDSADPEVRLDLARAYIAMGDREAARVILAEVIEHGDQKQQDEAKAMLGEL